MNATPPVLFPRELTQGEAMIRTGNVHRQISIVIDPSSSSCRRLGLALAAVSPYRIVRYTRQDDGNIQNKEVFPLPSEPEKLLGPMIWFMELFGEAFFCEGERS
jgi:hypothetical protein